MERQATDGAHRIGQTSKVSVCKLMARGTVEGKIQQLQERKQAPADALFDGGGPDFKRDGEILATLFQPLE